MSFGCCYSTIIVILMFMLRRRTRCQLYFPFNWNTRHFTEFVILCPRFSLRALLCCGEEGLCAFEWLSTEKNDVLHRLWIELILSRSYVSFLISYCQSDPARANKVRSWYKTKGLSVSGGLKALSLQCVTLKALSIERGWTGSRCATLV